MGSITKHYRKEEGWWFPEANLSPSVVTHSHGALRSGTEGGCCWRAEKQILLKAQGSGFVTHAIFLDFNPLLNAPGYPGHRFPSQLGRMRQLLSFLRASVTGVLEGQNEMPVC